MGNLHSIQSRTGRRSNRLSKPLTNKAYLSPTSPISPPAKSHASSAVSPRLTKWKDPWNGTSIPISPPASDTNGGLSQSLPSAPSVSFQPKAPRDGVVWSPRNNSIAEGSQCEQHHELLSPCFSNTGSMNRRPSLRPARRASFQSETLRASTQSPVNPIHPKRSYSLQSPPRRSNNIIYENNLEEATSSNTYFMVDNQRFSITRRRSLLTRPGVATRQSTRQSVRRLSPPNGQDFDGLSGKYIENSNSSQPPLSNNENTVAKSSFPPGSTRPHTPSDFGYTHLGALKLGSLRVVNGSTSPCSSDRTRNIPRTSSPEVSSEGVRLKKPTGPDRVENFNWQKRSRNCPPAQTKEVRPYHRPTSVAALNPTSSNVPTSTLHTLPLSDMQEQDDLPGSPFSFDKSPTTAAVLNQTPFLVQDEDEGISLKKDDSNGANLREKASTEKKGASSSLAQANNGYSSATSMRSLQDKNAKAPVDSGALDRHSWESGKLSVGDNIHSKRGDQPSSRSDKELPMQGHLSIQSPKANGYPSARSAYSPALDAASTTKQTESDDYRRSSSSAAPTGLRRTVSFSRPYAPPNNFECPLSGSEMLSFPQPPQSEGIRNVFSRSYLNAHGSTPSGSGISHHKTMPAPSPGVRRAASTTGKHPVRNYHRFDKNTPSGDGISHSRLQRHHTQKLPTKSTPVPQPNYHAMRGMMETLEENDYRSLPEISCDKVRTQHIETQSKFARPIKRRNIHMTASPFFFH